MNILGILYLKRDPSACLLMDGKIVAIAEEERFTRKKHAEDAFPNNAIKFCLSQGKIQMKDINFIAAGWDVNAYPGRMAEHFLKTSFKYKTKDEKTLNWEIGLLRKYSPEKYTKAIVDRLIEAGYKKQEIPPIKFVGHHYAHALTAYCCSGFKEAAVITMDGHGEENCTVLWEAKDGKLRKLKEFNMPDSIGWYYDAFTKFLGFRTYDGEGKVMGLAPYGKPNKKYKKYVQDMLKITPEGYEIDPTYLFYGKRTEADEYSDKFKDAFGAKRPSDKDTITQEHKDVAYECQERLEEVGMHLAEMALKETGMSNLCLAGGVALNCKMNGFIWLNDKVKNIFIQPMSGDDGSALGAAMAVHLETGGRMDGLKMEHVYYGPEFSNDEIKKALDKQGLKYTKSADIAKDAAKLIASGKILAWFQGRMEVGPRSLGSRSILVDPRSTELRDKINNHVKFREVWRPFCPSMLYEAAERYLEKPCYHPFMILTFNIKKERQKEIAGVVHVDGTARPQTVRKDINPKYWQVIKEFENLTGVPVLLNTSYNIKGEPIVCTPEDAIRTYLNTGMECLAIGDYLVKK
jgi:carbamoyltransferase